MKLVVEIGDYVKDGELRGWSSCCITPADKVEGISTLDKSKQIDKLSRLIDLSVIIKETVERFYQERTMSSPSSPISTSGEPGTT